MCAFARACVSVRACVNVCVCTCVRAVRQPLTPTSDKASTAASVGLL